MSTLMIRVVHDLQEAEDWWRQLNHSESWYNQWDVLLAFWKPFADEWKPVFWLIEEDGVAKGVLGGQFNQSKNRFEIWGGWFMEDIQVLGEDMTREMAEALLEQIPRPCVLDNLVGDWGMSLEKSDLKYVLPIESYTNLDEFLELKYSGDFRKELRKIKKNGEEGVVVSEGNLSNLDSLFQLNIERFGKESAFMDERLQQAFRNLVQLDYDWRILVFNIDSEIVGVSLGVLFKDTYIYHNSGVNLSAFSNLGKYVIMKNIEVAIEAGVKVLDAGTEDLGWKERWGLEGRQLWKYIKE